MARSPRRSVSCSSPAGAPTCSIVPAASFEPRQLDDAWLVGGRGDAEVNAAVARAAEARRMFVNAVDDPPNATAYLSGVVRRDGVTIAISTSGAAPGLTGLLREALDACFRRSSANGSRTAKRASATMRGGATALLGIRTRRRPAAASTAP